MSDENFYNLCHRVKSTAQTVTMKSEERSITEGSYISPPGHLSSIKNIQIKDDETSFDLVSMSGIRMEDGRTWPNSSKIFSRKVILKNNSFDTNNLRVLISFCTSVLFCTFVLCLNGCRRSRSTSTQNFGLLAQKFSELWSI